MLNRLGLVMHWMGFVLGCLVFLGGVIFFIGGELNKGFERLAEIRALEESLELAIEAEETYLHENREDNRDCVPRSTGNTISTCLDIRAVGVAGARYAIEEAAERYDDRDRKAWWWYIGVLFGALLSFIVCIIPFWTISFILTGNKSFLPWRRDQ